MRIQINTSDENPDPLSDPNPIVFTCYGSGSASLSLLHLEKVAHQKQFCKYIAFANPMIIIKFKHVT